MAFKNFALRVVVVSKDFSPSSGITTETEFDEVLFFPPSYTIRSLAQLDELIRAALVERISMTAGRERAREMRIGSLTAWFAHVCGVCRGVRLEERNLGNMLEYLQDRNDARDHLEVLAARKTPREVTRPIGGSGDRASRPLGGEGDSLDRPLTPTFGTTREAEQSRADARRRREEKEKQQGRGSAEERRRRLDRERLGRRFERQVGGVMGEDRGV